MQNNSNNVCRLCLKAVPDTNTAELISEVTRKIFDLLLIQLDWDVSVDPLMCGMCSDILDEIYLFKSKCLYSDDIIGAHFESNLNVSLRDILIELENKPDVEIALDQVVCRLCLKIPPDHNYISLNETGQKNVLFGLMIQKQLPEIDLSIIKKPIICEACRKLLENYSSFVNNCMDVERNIKQYCDHHRSNGKGLVDLASVLPFTGDKVNCGQTINEDLIIKQEERSVSIKAENIEYEENILFDVHFANISDNDSSLKKEQLQDDPISDTEDCKSQDKKIIETRHDSQIQSITEKPSKGGEIMPFCEICNACYASKSSLKRHKIMIHGEGDYYYCDKCTFRTMHEKRLNKHELRHNNPSFRYNTKVYMCNECQFTTKHKPSLKKHLLTHPSSEGVLFQGLNKEKILIHEKKLKPHIYRCDKCTFHTHHKTSIKYHACPYQTKISYGLEQHSVTHQKFGEAPIPVNNSLGEKPVLNCESCSYQTRNNSNFNKHVRTHRTGSQLPLRKCETCGGKYNKRYLNRHKRSCCTIQLDDESDSCNVEYITESSCANSTTTWP